MKLLLLTQWFDPEAIPKGLSFAKALAGHGWHVEVLTGFPNYPDGKVFPGYKIRLFQREIKDDIPIIRVALFPSHDSSALRRILNYGSFAFASAFIGLFLIKKPDVIYVYHPPSTVAFPALLFHFLFRTPFVYDIQDLWPDTLRATGMVRNHAVLKAISLWCHFTYAHAAAIVVLSQGFKKELVRRGVDSSRINVIYNWFDTQNLSAPGDGEDAELDQMKGKFNIVFAGTMGKAQALDAVIEAGILLSDVEAIQFVFVGGGTEAERLQRSALRKKGNKFIFLPQRSIKKVAPILKAADALLIHLKKDPLFTITIPSKTQAYLAVGRPIIIGVEGDAAELVREAEAGISCEPENPKSIASAVRTLHSMEPALRNAMGEKGRRYYQEHLSFEKGISLFDELLRIVASS